MTQPTYFKTIDATHDTLVVTLKTKTSLDRLFVLNAIARALGVKHDATLASDFFERHVEHAFEKQATLAFVALRAAVVPYKQSGRSRAGNTLRVAFTGDAHVLSRIHAISEQVMRETFAERTYAHVVLATPAGEAPNVVHLTFEKGLPWWAS